MGLCRTVSETDGDFCEKLQNFPTPRVFCAPADGVHFPLELDIGTWVRKNGMMIQNVLR